MSVYYLLIPRYAGRPLVAGKLISLAWLLAVIVNVIIWAHHIYLDWPQDTIQGAINTAMQPLTFSITLVSALSLYSLAATMYRSDFQWNPASRFLIAGLFGWLTAGLSGVVNATISLDVAIHNTLWIVGHFHQMALLNIGVVIFGAVYAFLPQITGNEWYSERLGNLHVALTLIGGYGMVIPWLAQGLTGAPRRFAELPPATRAGPPSRCRSSRCSPWARRCSPGTCSRPCAGAGARSTHRRSPTTAAAWAGRPPR